LKKFLGYGFKLFLLLSVVFVGWAIYLDVQVVKKFSGKKWSVPAKVFARPLELFTGGQLSSEALIQELKRLGYREEYLARDIGSYQVTPGQVILHTRGFQFWDTTDKARQLQISFQGNQVQRIENLKTNEDLDLIRLEPVMIGGIYPTSRGSSAR